MDKQFVENIYNVSIKTVIDKFVSSNNDFFLTEKDLHFYFFHSCLSKHSFEYNGRLLIHTEYPMHFKAKKNKDLFNPVEKINDVDQGMRPHIDSILFNPNFIKWISDNYKNEELRENCIRGLANKKFSEYIDEYRKIYKRFFDETNNESVLSHSLEFKFIRSGYDGIKEPLKNILCDLKKLELIGEVNKNFKFPFSKKCTLLIFIGKRELIKEKRTVGIIEELDNAEEKYKKLLKKFSRTKPEYSDDRERCVIRYDLRR